MNGILIFGDSITAGRGVAKDKTWVGRLVRVFDKKDKDNFIIYNLGIPGESTAELLKRFKIECQSRTRRQCPDDSFIVIINIGLNDSKYINGNPKTPICTFRKNINKLIDIARRYTQKIIFIELMPVVDKKTPLLFSNKIIGIYNNFIREICNKKTILFLDTFKYLQRNRKKLFCEDGIHLNRIGHQKVFEIIMKYLELKNMF